MALETHRSVLKRPKEATVTKATRRRGMPRDSGEHPTPAEGRYQWIRVTAVIGVTAFVALFDFWASPTLVGSILFTFPLALCAMQSSKLMLWGTSAAAALLTISPEFWAISRGRLYDPWEASVNRGLVIASLLTLTTLIHFRIKHQERNLLDIAEIDRERIGALAQNEQLETLKAKYLGLLEAAPDAMIVVNADSEIVLVNLQAEKQFGYRRDELLGQKVTNIIPQGFAERLVADSSRGAAEALAQHIGTGIELLALRKDGSEFPIEIMLSPLENAQGMLVTAAIRNISLRKDAEFHLEKVEHGRRLTDEALRQSEARYQLLLDGIQDYAIYMMDPFGTIVSWNAGAERIKGYSAEQIIGQNFSCFYPPVDVDRGWPQEVLRITAENGRHEELGMRVRKDGSQFLATLVFTALRDAAGNLQGISEFSHDMSESKESGAKYRGLLEAAPDAMVVVDEDGKIVLLNVQAEKQFGYRRDELLGQKVTNIIPQGFAERLVADSSRGAAEALAQHIGTGIELLALRKDGSEFPIEIMLSPLENAQGILVTAAIRDISMRRKAEEHLLKTARELKRSNEELRQFASVASHDLQEPLRMVAGYTELLARRYKGKLDSDAEEFIAFAVDGCNRMQGLIRDLLRYSRAGKGVEILHQVSSEQALDDALVSLRSLIDESGAVVTRGWLPETIIGSTQLAQVFQNLVGNAIKYRSLEVPRVHVSAARNDAGDCVFSVKDNGLGIEAQYFERIFILFQRLHGRHEFEGTGIGLAICKKVVEAAGGRIWVESQPGSGSTFLFVMPEKSEAGKYRK